MANVPTDPPVSRTIDFGALVRKILGDEYHKHETVYQFSGGRKFESSDYGTQGLYGGTQAIVRAGTAQDGGASFITLATSANGSPADYQSKVISAVDFATTTQTSRVVDFNPTSFVTRVVPPWSSNFVLHTGTTQGAGVAVMTLGTGAPSALSGTLSITGGAGTWTGGTQAREIIAYNGSTKVAAVSKWDAPYLVGNGNSDEGAQATFYLPFADLGAGAVDTTPAFSTVSPTFTRATPAWTRNSAGARVEVASGVARSYYAANGTYLGYLAEGVRTNHFLNSDAPATQTSPSLGTATYTLWIEGSGSIEVAANTATITGAGTAIAGTPVTFVVTGAGTVDYTVTGSPTFAQSENGAFASTWIVTAGASVTRNADVLTYPTTGWFVATAGAMVADFAPLSGSVALTQAVFSIYTNTSNYFAIEKFNANASGDIVNGGVTQALMASTATSNGVPISGAMAYAANDGAASFNGGTVGTDASVTLPTVTTAGIGHNAGANFLFGPIRRVAYFPQRLLDVTLQYITANGLTFSPSTFARALPDSTTTYRVEKVGPGVNTTYSISA